MADSVIDRWVTFDVYSALFDFRGSLLPALTQALDGDDRSHAKGVLECWRTRQLAVAMHHSMLQRGHLSFRRATALALDYALATNAIDLPRRVRQSLVDAWDELSPWPDAPAALAKLHEQGYRLALLSNGDQDMLEALARRLPFIEAVLSAERAGAYKPHPNVYWHALHTLDVLPEALIHVAGSSTDVMGARAAGLACAWSNRFDDRLVEPRFTPDWVVADLSQLPAVLAYGVVS
ncbi:haloacid dehalogenase type II [Salinisphaera sp. T31B1]|uniref:haloacid dehalogenase type II n=1 Tax=Salinisphaera sp. T31B1 TaxID=727963 RepID=UPI0033420FEF